ncbi:MAG: SDR family oxidoreductase [Hyphomicrobiaceae bacterium]|nr:SDR family oxidoreductase [Hyphomicrobiaceae bacterium]
MAIEGADQFGFTPEQLAELPTVYRGDLFKGQVVAVTGAGSGFGLAIACLFARLGADLAITGRNDERVRKARAFLESFGGRVESWLFNIRDADADTRFIAEVWERLGRLDVIVNNAGGQFPQAAIDFKPKGWNAVIDNNLNGTWYMMQAAAREWVARGTGGNIVNIVADFWRGMPGIAHTAAARAGVTYASKTVAVEWAPHCIRVNCVAPGCLETSGFAHYPPEGAATYKEANPMKRVGDAWDVAEACVYLAAPSGKFITGEVLTVDGGQQLWGDPWPTGRPEWFKLG